MNLEEKIIKELQERNYSITTAESCTGGLLAGRLLNVSGASAVYNEGHITYSNEAKNRLLGVKNETIEKYGVVSEETAREMVIGAAKAAKADCAISVTGVAGPDGGTKEKPVGTVYAGFYCKGVVEVVRYNFSGDRYEVRCKTTQNTIEKMLEISDSLNDGTTPVQYDFYASDKTKSFEKTVKVLLGDYNKDFEIEQVDIEKV